MVVEVGGSACRLWLWKLVVDGGSACRLWLGKLQVVVVVVVVVHVVGRGCRLCLQVVVVDVVVVGGGCCRLWLWLRSWLWTLWVAQVSRGEARPQHVS